LVSETIIVRGNVANPSEAIDSIYSQIVSELGVELADGAELLCLSCGAIFCGTEEFGAIVIRPHSKRDGHVGAACKECALAATNDDLASAFHAEWGANC
jgi:hypothetical protein